jgi:hypothetical protein
MAQIELKEIHVHKATYDRIRRFGKDQDSYSEILDKMCDVCEGKRKRSRLLSQIWHCWLHVLIIFDSIIYEFKAEMLPPPKDGDPIVVRDHRNNIEAVCGISCYHKLFFGM